MDDITASIIVTCQTEGAAASVSKLGYAFAQLARKSVEFGVQSIKAFSDMQEETNKFNVVFQGSGRKSKKVVDELIAGYGASEFSAKKMLSATGDLLTGLGVERDVSLELAEATAKLGSDLASFSNYAGGAEGAAMALTKGMLGERESMKMLGIVIREDDEAYKALQKQAMTTGVTIDALGKTFKVSSEQQAKAVATIALAYKQSPNAIGDFARSQNSIANAGRILSNRFLDLKIAVGAFLDELGGIGGIQTDIAGVFQNITKWIKANTNEWAFAIKSFALGVKLSIKQFAALFQPLVTGIAAGFQNIGTMGQWFNDNWGKIWSNGAEVVKAMFLDIWEYIKWFWGPDGMIIGFFSKAGKAIWGALKAGMTGGDAGKVFADAFGSYVNENIIGGFAKQGKHMEAALAKAGVSPLPELKGADWDIAGTWNKQYAEYEREMQKLELDYEKKMDARFKKTPPAASPAAEAKKLVELGKGVSLGSFSVAELNQQLAGSMGPAAKTADNTAKTVTLLQEMLQKIPSLFKSIGEPNFVIKPNAVPNANAVTPERQPNTLVMPEVPTIPAAKTADNTALSKILAIAKKQKSLLETIADKDPGVIIYQ